MFPLAVISVILSISSMAYSAHQASKVRKAQRRAKQEAERKAELAKGFQFVNTVVTNGVIDPGGTLTGFLDFPTTTSTYYRPKQVHKLVNSNANWTGTWSLVPSSDTEYMGSEDVD